MACTVFPRPMSSARRRRPRLDTAKLQGNNNDLNTQRNTKMKSMTVEEWKTHRSNPLNLEKLKSHRDGTEILTCYDAFLFI